MNEKQLIIYFQADIFEKIKNRCLQIKRSLVSQLRVILDNIPDDENILNYYKWKYAHIKNSSNNIKTSVKLPEPEYWATVRKAAICFLKVTDFINFILTLWINNDLAVSMFKPHDQTATGAKAFNGDQTGNGSQIWANYNNILYKSEKNGEIKNIEGINLAYVWKGEDIKISWKANCLFSGDLWLVFTKSDPNKVIGEFLLGSRLEGELKFNTKSLGIDLSSQTAFPIIVAKDSNLWNIRGKKYDLLTIEQLPPETEKIFNPIDSVIEIFNPINKVIDETNISNIADTFTKNIDAIRPIIVEYKNKNTNKYWGGSIHLSYFLILLSKYFEFNKHFSQYNKYDIWCTAKISGDRNEYNIERVDINAFIIKLNAFISGKDNLFIVPRQNIERIDINIIRNINVLSLHKFRKKLPYILNEKTILKVEYNELDYLANTILKENYCLT